MNQKKEKLLDSHSIMTIWIRSGMSKGKLKCGTSSVDFDQIETTVACQFNTEKYYYKGKNDTNEDSLMKEELQ